MLYVINGIITYRELGARRSTSFRRAVVESHHLLESHLIAQFGPTLFGELASTNLMPEQIAPVSAMLSTIT